jgi:Uma2 family endonuclease
METVTLPEPIVEEIELPPTEDELPYDDGMPMESQRHVFQMFFLIEALQFHLKEQNAFVGGNMFVYFSMEQVRGRDFRGPDFFAVLDVPRRERKSWVVWQEGKGPDVIIELLSESTAKFDKGEKKQVYQDQLRVPEYFWYDPFSGELAGFTLRDGVYEPIAPDAQGRLVSQRLNLALVRWDGVYVGVPAKWLRWSTLDGDILLTSREHEHQLSQQAQQQAEQAQQQAEQAQQQAEQAQQQAEQAQQQAADLEAKLARYRERFGEVD